MDKGNGYQLELFSGQHNIGAGINGKDTRMLSFLRGYERAIFTAICLIIISVAAFSLGVRRGMQAREIKSVPVESMPRPEEKVKTDKAVLPAPVANPSATAPAKAQEFYQAPIRKETKPKDKNVNYTIQLATYKEKANVKKEAESLKKKGFTPVVISEGKHTVLCVGRFPSKDNATKLLSQLRKQYQGCFVRRL